MTQDDQQIRCGKCRFFQPPPESSQQFGQCRRSAPVSKFANNQTDLVSWPLVESDDWCGEAQPTEVQAERDKLRTAWREWTAYAEAQPTDAAPVPDAGKMTTAPSEKEIAAWEAKARSEPIAGFLGDYRLDTHQITAGVAMMRRAATASDAKLPAEPSASDSAYLISQW